MKIKPLSKYLFLYQTSENFSAEKIKKIDVLLVFLSILLSGGLTYLSPQLYGSLTIIILILVLALIGKNNKVNRVSLKNFFIVLFFVIFIFFIKYVFLSEFQAISHYVYRLINIVIALLILLYFSNNYEYLIKIIYIVLYFIMLQALLSFLAWYVIQNSLTHIPSVKSDTFYFLFYYTHFEPGGAGQTRLIEYLGFNFFRNNGIFWESGILQFYINILLYLSLFVYGNNKIALLSTIVILTSWSSTGLVILSIQLFFYIIVKTKRKDILKSFILIIIFSLMLIPLQENLTDKLEGENAGSGYARALDTFTAINIIINNPTLGIDLDSAVYEKERLKNRANIDMAGSRIERDASNTNSILNYFVFLGIPLGLLILYSLYSQTIFLKNKLVFFLIIFMSILTEPLGFFIFPLMLLFSSYILKKNHTGVYYD